MRTLIRFAPLTLALLLLGQGCLIGFGGGGTDGGVYRTANRGQEWIQKGAVLSVGGARSLANANILVFEADPQDPATVYAGTGEDGLFYTTDGGESWTQPRALSGARIGSIAVDPRNKCVVYATSGAVVVKTTDCTRTWSKAFEDTRAEVALASVVVDHFNPSIVFVGTSKGDLLKSSDAGASWAPQRVFGSAVARIVVDPFDSRVLMVGTRGNGVWRSPDGGANWTDVSGDLSRFDGTRDLYDLVSDRSARDTYVLVSRYGLNKTADGGTHWEAVNLLTPPGQTRIYSFALNPKNGLEMYYATATIFYRTGSGGPPWTTRRLPTSRAGSALLVDPANPASLYLGTIKLKQ